MPRLFRWIPATGGRRLRSADRSIDDRGGVAIEFAIVGPLLLVMVFGILSYGGYFWLSHSIQQLANDAARSALAGLSANERQQLAQSTMQSEIGSYGMLSSSYATTTVSSQTDSMTVSVSYNGAGTPFWSMDALIPMPPQTITRSATIKLAGF